MKIYKCKECGGYHITDYCPESDDPLHISGENYKD